MKNKLTHTIIIFFICGILFVSSLTINGRAIIEENESKEVFYEPPTPPQQPPDGPGGSNYTHEGVKQTRYGFGSHAFWIFEPAEPTPSSAPLIVFNHGWSAFFPQYYKAWIEHLVKRGNIVVYPRYQLGLIIGVRQATQHAIQAVKEAITILSMENHVQPDLDKFAIVGHSLGGGITAEMAVLTEETGIPSPKAIMPVQPFVRLDTMMKNFHDIPSSVLLLVVTGDNDTIVGNESGKLIFTSSDQIPADRKDFIIQQTDEHGSPSLVANHFAPLCIPDDMWVNALDYYSTWKLFDALTDYAFYGKNKEYCLGNTPEQRFMGYWSDGTPVRELVITDSP